jgi:hypothetical protein
MIGPISIEGRKMGHTQHYQTAILANNGCGFYRHETLRSAIDATVEALCSGQLAYYFTVIKAFPPCPPAILAAAQAAKQLRVAEFEAQVQAGIDESGWDFPGDIPF